MVDCTQCRRDTFVDEERLRLALTAEVVAREKEISAMQRYLLWMADRIHWLETKGA